MKGLSLLSLVAVTSLSISAFAQECRLDYGQEDLNELRLGDNYPRPIVDHAQARERTLQRYAVVREAAGAPGGQRRPRKKQRPARR